MSQRRAHPFLTRLAKDERSRWLALLFDNPSSGSEPYGIPFPALIPGLSPDAWLNDEFQWVGELADSRDRIRSSVVELVATELTAVREELSNPVQVLGLLLQVAGQCGFTEVSSTLAGWVQRDAYGEDRYRLLGEEVPLRRTVWSILIAWHNTNDLRDYLKKDLTLPAERGSAQLCFAELGRLVPAEAICFIPDTFAWPAAYQIPVLRRFFSGLGARNLLSPEYHAAWQACIRALVTRHVPASIFFQSDRRRAFHLVLDEIGVYFEMNDVVTELRPKEYPLEGLKIQLSPFIEEFDRHVTEESSRSFAKPAQAYVAASASP